MTLIDVVTAIVVLGLFVSGFLPVIFPAYNAWETALSQFRTAKTIQFISESFRNECIKPDRNIMEWKKSMTASSVDLNDCEITELRQGNILRALKVSFSVSGEFVEVVGLCTP